MNHRHGYLDLEEEGVFQREHMGTAELVGQLQMKHAIVYETFGHVKIG